MRRVGVSPRGEGEGGLVSLHNAEAFFRFVAARSPGGAANVEALLADYVQVLGRSPDELPFSGRRSSALGTMSVSEALRAFSTETVVAGKHAQPPNARLASELPARSAFMRPLEGSPYRDEKM